MTWPLLLIGQRFFFVIYFRVRQPERIPTFSHNLGLNFTTMELFIAAAVGIVILFILYRIFKTFIKWTIFLFVVFIAIAFFTNPEESTHRESLKDKVQELQLKKIRDKRIEVVDYKIFSFTKVKENGESKIVGVGAFGKVWYFGDVEEKLKK